MHFVKLLFIIGLKIFVPKFSPLKKVALDELCSIILIICVDFLMLN